MQLRDALFSSESVTEGHPDKVCDQVSDAVLDECLRQDKSSRVALETAVKTGLVLLIGEITTRARLEYSNIVRRTVERIGFNDGSMGFDDETLQPTYVLRLGAPGKSAGLDIASRLGLDPELIESARSRMTNTERDVSRFLNELHARIDTVEQQGKDLAAREQELDSREKSLEKAWEKKYTEKLQQIDKEITRLSQEFEQRAEETIG